jgi:glycerate kinase
VGFALLAVLGARMQAGADLVAGLTGLADAVCTADLVITGEGSLDVQSLRGKAPTAVAAMARDKGVPVVAVAGRVALDEATLRAAGIGAAYPLLAEADDEREAFERPGPLLERIGARIARDHLGGAS